MGTITLSCSGSTYVSSKNKTADNSSASLLRTSYTFKRCMDGESLSTSSEYDGAILRFTRPSSIKYKRITNVILRYTLTYSNVIQGYEYLSFAPYASNTALSSINYSNIKTSGAMGEWSLRRENLYGTNSSSQSIDLTSAFASNLVNDVFNVIIADTHYPYATDGTVIGGATISPSSASLVITYEDVTQEAPTATYPKDIYLRESSSTLFTWQFNSSTEAVQASATLEYKLASAGSYTAVTVGADHSYTLDSRLTAGVYNWRVKVINDAGEASGYSDVATFTIIGNPAVPVIGTPENKTLTTISWSAADQCAYDIVIKDSVDKVLISESIADTATTYKPNMFLNGTYSVSVRVKNSADLWSEWANKAFTISASGPSSATLNASASGANVSLTFALPDNVKGAVIRSEAGGEYKVLKMLEVGETEYVDDTVKTGITYTYRIRTYADGYTDSAESSAMVKFAGMFLQTDNDVIQLQMSEDKYLSHAEGISRETSIMNYSGREYPLVERGEFTNVSIVKKAFATYDEKDTLDRMIKVTEAWYRDGHGNSYPVAVTSAQYDSWMNRGYSVTLNMVRVDESEVDINV